MKITFTELEPADRHGFTAAFGSHELRFVDHLASVAEDAEILSVFINSEIDSSFLETHRDLRLVATRSTTVDHIDLEACERRGVAVAAVPSYGDHVVAEHVFALLLALTRRLREAMEIHSRREFSYEALRGLELRGKTFGLFAAGRVGRHTVPIARGFGMEVIAYDPAPDLAAAQCEGFRYVSFDELLRRSDILSLHAPLTSETYHVIDAAALARCRPGVIIINTARGRLIDTLALIDALDSGQVGAAGLDVLGEEAALRHHTSNLLVDQILQALRSESSESAPDRAAKILKLIRTGKLLERRNVIFTPHTAFNCVEAVERIEAATIRNIEQFIASGRPADAPPKVQTVQLAPG